MCLMEIVKRGFGDREVASRHLYLCCVTGSECSLQVIVNTNVTL